MRTSNRRTVLRSLLGIGAAGVGTVTSGVAGASGPDEDEYTPPTGGGSESWPQTHHTDTKVDRYEFGYEYYYRSSAGSWLNFLDSVFVAGSWEYVFRTEAHAECTKENAADGYEPFQYDVFDGDMSVEVTEQSNQSEISTTYVSDADWGHGATVASEQGYSWADATVDSVKTVESYFNPAVGTYFTARDIVSYWDKASNDSDTDDGIDVTWTRYQRMPHTGQYIKYRHYFPPKSEYSGEYVDVETTNTLKNTLYESDGMEYPTGDYQKTFSYSILVEESPESMSVEERSQRGIVETDASSYYTTGQLTARGISPDRTVYVNTDPEVELR